MHWADHHYAVGKKQWTWGDAEFGRAWSANLTDNGSTYIELMAGVYTDNQPDFSRLAPGETKTFSQYWYPIAGTGPAVAATLDVALGVAVSADHTTLRLESTRDLGPVELIVTGADGRTVHRASTELSPKRALSAVLGTTDNIQVVLRNGPNTLLNWPPRTGELADTGSTTADGSDLRPAREPDPPALLGSVEELYLTGLHLEQNRHATRSPEPYWREALARDRGHSPTHTALAARRYRTGRYAEAEQHLRAATERLTSLNPNPQVGEAHYLLGLTLLRLGRRAEAYDLFAKATWLDAWVAAGNHQLAIIDAYSHHDEQALERADTELQARPDHSQVRNLCVVLLRRLGRGEEAERALGETLATDPLDVWGRYLAGSLDPAAGHTEAQTLIDIAMESTRIGALDSALELLALARRNDQHRPLGQTACAVISNYLAATIYDALNDTATADEHRARARAGDRTWNFAARLDDVAALEAALAADTTDATAAARLGHWCYAHGRVDDAVTYWQRSVAHDPTDPVVWRNLGLAAFNQAHDAEAATAAYEQALALAPTDTKLIFEYDQLLKRIGPPHQAAPVPTRAAARAARGTRRPVCGVCPPAGQRATAGRCAGCSRRSPVPTVGGRRGTGAASLGTRAARARPRGCHDRPGRDSRARPVCDRNPRHPRRGPAPAGQPGPAAARPRRRAQRRWLGGEGRGRLAASRSSRRRLQRHGPAGLLGEDLLLRAAARRLGNTADADRLVTGLAAYTDELAQTAAKIDYFATSLPSLLLFDDDPQRRQDLEVELLRAQLALLGGEQATARRHLDTILLADPSHELALDLLHTVQPTRSLS